MEREVAIRTARFKSRLRAAATAAGYDNIFELGRECGMSKDSFKKYMSGTRLPSFECILRLSIILGVPADWLMGCDEAPLLRSVLVARDIDVRRKRALEERGLAGVDPDSAQAEDPEEQEADSGQTGEPEELQKEVNPDDFSSSREAECA